MTESCVLTGVEEGGVSWVVEGNTPNKKKGYAVEESRVIALENPGSPGKGALTEVLRNGARQVRPLSHLRYVPVHIVNLVRIDFFDFFETRSVASRG